MLVSDFSLRLDSTIKHYKWDLDKIAFSPEERTLSSHWLENFGLWKCRSFYPKLHPPGYHYGKMIVILDLSFLYPRSSRRHHPRSHHRLRHVCPLFRYSQETSCEHSSMHSTWADRQPDPSTPSSRRRPHSSAAASAAPWRRSLTCGALTFEQPFLTLSPIFHLV